MTKNVEVLRMCFKKKIVLKRYLAGGDAGCPAGAGGLVHYPY